MSDCFLRVLHGCCSAGRADLLYGRRRHRSSRVPVDRAYTDLRAAGDKTRLILVQNMGHKFKQVGSQLINPGQQQLAKDAASFFDKTRAR